MTIKLIVNGYDYTPDVITFPAGEVNINILKGSKGLRTMQTIEYIIIEAHLRNAEDIMQLLLIKDAVDRLPNLNLASVNLVLPYLPYARQDRVCNKGEAHSLKVMCNLINNMNFNTVVVSDCHSIVGTGLLNNCRERTQTSIISTNTELSNKLRSGNYCIVSPDAGSEKKCMDVAKHFNCKMIRATKRRDVATGKIEHIGFVDDIPEGKNFLIIDDIIDGGGTFLPLAEILQSKNTGYELIATVDLYATHGIFSKGLQTLHKSFDTIYTTDSYFEGIGTSKTKVIKL